MDPIQLIVLSFIQSITEFLPVSSTAHLIMVPYFTSFKDQGLTFDLALHLGTLGAVLFYFREDVKELIFGALKFSLKSEETNYLLKVVLATVPILAAGLLVEKYTENMRVLWVIGTASIVFGVLLGVADHRSRKTKMLADLTFAMAFLIGLAQVCAILPGVSRSGVTMTAALFLGLQRAEAARFSMVISIPAIGAASAYKMLQLALAPQPFPVEMIYGIILAFLGGLGAISFLMHWLKNYSFQAFAVYRVILGVVLLFLFFLGE